ncbi:hypothetical protein Are01nite_42870 [Actinoplanes regularis]|nr:hypothetical protein Are01nite_42870 [Actinoplanes regularis]
MPADRQRKMIGLTHPGTNSRVVPSANVQRLANGKACSVSVVELSSPQYLSIVRSPPGTPATHVATARANAQAAPRVILPLGDM